MSISNRLDQIEARADAATEGPWEKHTVNGWEMVVSYSTDAMIQLVAEFRHKERDLNDAEFIAASRTDVPALVAALRAVLDLHKPRNGHDDCGHCVDPADAHWGIPWPCPTVRAVTAALGEES